MSLSPTSSAPTADSEGPVRKPPMKPVYPPSFISKLAQTSLGNMRFYQNANQPSTESTNPTKLVFFHGFGGGASAYEWSKIYPVFATTHTVIAPDLLGWGQSEHPQRTYSPQDYVLTLKEFILAVTHPPVTAIASSLTAAFVVRIAVQHPELFQSLFLVCPSGFHDFGSPAGRRIPLPLINTPLLDRLIYSVGATNEIAVRGFLERFVFATRDRLSPETVAAYLASAQQPNAEFAALSFLRGELYFDLATYLPKLQVPTAIAWGEAAQFISPQLGQRLAALNPESIHQFHLIPDAGIFPHLERPAITTGLLLRWLQSSGQ